MPEISSDIIIGLDKMSEEKNQNCLFLDNLLLSELRLAPPLSWELEKEKKNLGVELIFYSKKVFKRYWQLLQRQSRQRS